MRQVLLYRGIGQHPVSLVKDQKLQIAEILLETKLVMLQLMHQAARGPYHHMGYLIKLACLDHHIDTPYNN